MGPLFGAGAAPASGSVAAAGVCTFDNLSIAASVPPVQPGPTPAVPTAVVVSGTGTCLMSDTEEHDAALGGTLAFLPSVPNYSCAGGVATGSITLSIDDFGAETFTGGGALVVGPAAAALAFASPPLPPLPQFAGAGVFAKTSTHTAACVTAGSSSTTWSGKLVFEDPASPV